MDVPAPAATTDGRRLRGERTRSAILGHAARVASTEGLESVSLQRLADDLGISKSGLFAHFGSKAELQLATVEEAARVFTDEVLRPALSVPSGAGRLQALSEAFLSYLERGVFPGGCFFEATMTEFDHKPGALRDAITSRKRYFGASLARAAREAQAKGDINRRVDPDQLAWELGAMLSAANNTYAAGDSSAYERARRAIRDRLELARAP